MLGPAPCAVCRRRSGWFCPTCVRAAAPAVEAPPPAGVDAAVAAWAYRGGPRSLVLALKLRHQRGAAGPLTERMVAVARRRGLDGDAVCWVPARPRDIASRGFDHAEVLARGVAARLGLPLRRLLERHGIQPDQAGLDRAERLKNLEGAFRTTGAAPRAVILVDDLWTTGATACAAAASLQASGTSEVRLLVACRA